MLIGTRRSLLGVGTSYIDKILGIEPANLVGLWPQNEVVGSVSLDKSVHRHHGAYTGVTLGQPGVPGMRLTSPLYDGTNDYNDIFAVANPNLLSNPGFETAGGGDPDFWANWTESVGDGALANETTLVHEGVDAAELTSGASKSTRILQAGITVVAGKSYRLRFWSRGDGTKDIRYRVYDVTGSTSIVGLTVAGNITTTYAATVREFTAPANCVEIRIEFWGGNGDGAAGYVDACEVRSMDGFLGDEGTLLAWAKVSAAGVWTDGVGRYVTFFEADANNRIFILKSAANDKLSLAYRAGGTSELLEKTSFSETGWMCWALTWSKSGNAVKAYYQGAQDGGTQTIAATWLGDLTSTKTVIGAADTVPNTVWSGEIGPVALWNKALTADQIAYLSKV